LKWQTCTSSAEETLNQIDEIRARATEDGYVIIRGAISGEEQIQRLLEHIRNKFNPRADVRKSGEYTREMNDFHRRSLSAQR
jgi:hypothetical protein